MNTTWDFGKDVTYEILIANLGGYEKAKAFLNASSYTVDELIMMQRSGLRPQHVEKALLQHRREHGIYEVGDKVVRTGDDKPDGIYTYERCNERMNLHFFESDFDYGHLRLCGVKHATDEEIKANKRLEVG